MATRSATANTKNGNGMNSVVTYKWLLSIVGPLGLTLAGVVLWAGTAMIAPVEQKTDANASRLDRQEQRTQQQLDRIEQKVDRIGARILREKP